ncbi:MAG TPA: S8 family serine peptidase [Myxococcales bacterium]|nr:S8 family serine peptidase [Myxococcales bacterium]
MNRMIAFLVAAFAGSAVAAPTQYLVVSKGNDTAAAVAAVTAAGGTVKYDLSKIGVVTALSDSATFAASVAANPAVLSVDADPDIQWFPPGEDAVEIPASLADTAPNHETFSALQWNLRQIHADQTAAAGFLGQGAVVAVIDSGINTGHVDIHDNIDFVHSRAFVQTTAPGAVFPFEDDNFHGSHVACIIAAEVNGVGVQGVAPKATLISLKTQNAAGSGSFSNVIAAIEYAASLGFVDAINMSLGATFDRINAGGNGGGGPDNSFGHFLAALGRAINHATQSGILVISAAGNDGLDLDGSPVNGGGRIWTVPAQSGNGMAIGATGPIAQANFDRLASYSNYGSSVLSVVAPGGDLVPPNGVVQDLVPSCGNKRGTTVNTFFFAAGTSMATPHVAGLAALLVGKYGHVGPAKLRALISNSAVNILPTPQQGKGRIDAAAALK